MFGLIYSFISIGTAIVGHVKSNHEVKERKQRAIEQGYNLYTDSNGTARHVDTDEPFSHRWINGELCEYNPYTGKIIKNITAEKREKAAMEGYAKALQDGSKFYSFEPKDSYRYRHDLDPIPGIRFKKIGGNQNDIYVRRRIYGKIWYYNLTTGLYEYCDVDKIKDGKVSYFIPSKEPFGPMSIESTFDEKLLEEERKVINEWQTSVKCKVNSPSFMDYRKE